MIGVIALWALFALFLFWTLLLGTMVITAIIDFSTGDADDAFGWIICGGSALILMSAATVYVGLLAGNA